MTLEPTWALDTSAAVPLLVASHPAHDFVSRWAQDRTLGLCGHALIETYSVLTRLPADARVSASDAVALIDDNFRHRVTIDEGTSYGAHRELARRGVTGGATYDGLVALAAIANDAVLVTRDARARPTYEAVGARVEVLDDPG